VGGCVGVGGTVRLAVDSRNGVHHRDNVTFLRGSQAQPRQPTAEERATRLCVYSCLSRNGRLKRGARTPKGARGWGSWTSEGKPFPLAQHEKTNCIRSENVCTPLPSRTRMGEPSKNRIRRQGVRVGERRAGGATMRWGEAVEAHTYGSGWVLLFGSLCIR
jgi:hypothetical protein